MKCSASKSFTLIPVLLAMATLALAPLERTIAWGSGGSMGGGFKIAFMDFDLFCDLSDPRSTAQITSLPPSADPVFIFTGNMVCAEVPNSVADPTLADAVDLDADGGPDIGLFNLVQANLSPPVVYLEESNVDLGDDGLGTRRSWTFVVANGPPAEVLLWRLEPVDAVAQKFCAASGSPVDCAAKFGTPSPAKASDFPSRDTSGDGVDDLARGEVFKFTTVIPDSTGVEKPESLFFGPCHNASFDAADPIACVINLGKDGKLQTRGKGKVDGTILLDVDIQPNTESNSLNVSNTSTTSTFPVAILGSAALPVGPLEDLNIDPDSVKVNGQFVPLDDYSVADVSSPLGMPGADGHDDLVLNFHRQSFIQVVNDPACTETETRTVTFTGTLTDADATPFEGRDDLTLHNCL